MVEALKEKELGELLMILIETSLVKITIQVVSLVVMLVVCGRMFEIYVCSSVSAIPFATIGNKEWGQIGNSYIRGLFALGLQGLFLMVCLGVYAVLIKTIQIENIHHLTIHVASVTEMSPKLLSFEQFSNISLYPNANIATIKQLMERASWYLDVNRGNELLNAVREAFNYQLITASFTETYHNAKFTNDQLIIDANQIDELCQVIQTAQDNLEFKAALLAEQKIQAHQTTIERYRDVFNNSEEDNHVRY